MRSFFVIVAMLFVSWYPVGLCAQPADSALSKPPKIGKYGDLLKRVQAMDTTVDFLEFRLAFAKSGNYKPYRRDLEDLQEKMRFEFRMGHFADAIKAAEKILKKEYINNDAHLFCALASDSLGDTANAQFHRFVNIGLLRSILASGDGSCKDSAYFVVLVSEEYATLKTLGYQPAEQAVGPGAEGRTYDIFKVRDSATGEEKTVYFDITWPFSKLKASF